jgi:hypothetical protein
MFYVIPNYGSVDCSFQNTEGLAVVLLNFDEKGNFGISYQIFFTTNQNAMKFVLK